MIRQPPISTLTDTLFPYTTLFRSCCLEDLGIAERRPCPVRVSGDAILLVRRLCRRGFRFHSFRIVEIGALRQRGAAIDRHRYRAGNVGWHQRRILPVLLRSEERQVGKEWVRKCTTGGSV